MLHRLAQDVGRGVETVQVAVDLESAAGLGSPGEDQRKICTMAGQSHTQVRHLKASLPTLEDVFARAIGEA